MPSIPSEFAIGGVYFPPLLIASFLGVLATVPTVMLLNRYRLSRFLFFPPLLIAGLLGFFAAWLTTQLLNRYRLSRFFAYPPLVLLALGVIYTVAFGTFVIPG